VQQVLTLVGALVALVALVATSVGVIAAVEQLTLRARLRRTAELAQALVASEDDPARQTVLRSIHDCVSDGHRSGRCKPERAHGLVGGTEPLHSVVPRAGS
jgi:signal transduction histidine kinase